MFRFSIIGFALLFGGIFVLLGFPFVPNNIQAAHLLWIDWTTYTPDGGLEPGVDYTPGGSFPVSWGSAIGAVRYRIQVSQTSTAGPIVHDQYENAPTTSHTIPSGTLIQGNTYYWKVGNCHSLVNCSDPTEVTWGAYRPWVLQYNKPTPSSPSNGATGQSLTPTLTWNAVSPAPANYRWQICTTSSCSTQIIAGNSGGATSDTVPAGYLVNATTYYWRVASCTNNICNQIGRNWGPVWSFTTTLGPPVATVTPSSWNYGIVGIGGTASHTFTIQNTGGGTLDGSVTGLGGVFTCASGCTYSLGPGVTQNIDLEFAPTSTSAVSATATFTNISNPGGTDTVSLSGSGTNAINANFSASPLSGTVPLTVNFNDLSSPGSGETLSSWSWNFGDGSPVDTSPNPSHTYASTGTYTVTLTVTDTGSASDTETKPNYITVTPPAAVPPTADFTYTVSGLDVTVTDASTPGSPGTLGPGATWVWDWGDGTPTTSGKGPHTHTYSTGGTYSITLTVTDDIGASGTVSKPVDVSPPSPPTGLVPCGLRADDTTTPWNDTEPCRLAHSILLLRNVVNFALWRLVPFIIAIMVIVTGVLFYFSFGSTSTLVTVKRIWRYIGIGLPILIFSWIFLNFFLGVLGFDINVFGQWYNISF